MVDRHVDSLRIKMFLCSAMAEVTYSMDARYHVRIFCRVLCAEVVGATSSGGFLDKTRTHSGSVRCDMPGTYYILPEAYDVDAESYAVVRYELTDDAALTSRGDEMPFRLEPVSRNDLTSSYELRLVVTRALDREVHQ